MPTISFVPNDPDAGFPARQRASAPDRSPGTAQLDIRSPAASAPASEVALYWQCREAALQSLSLWESGYGSLKRWSAPGRLELRPFEKGNGGPDAEFDRKRIRFYNASGVTPAASVDVVTHELGHAILHSVVPELMSSADLEHQAFHEAFGDCLALQAALDDADVATAALQAGLDKAHAGEALLENMSRAVAQARGLPIQSLVRHALNQAQWTANPTFTSEMDAEYQLSQVFTGCIYDAIVRLFDLRTGATAADLAAAARAVGKLMALAVDDGHYGRNIFRSMGSSMLAATTDAAEREALKQGFAGHGLEITSTGIAQPVEAFSGPVPTGPQHAIAPVLSRRVAQRFGLTRKRRSPCGQIQVRGTRVYWFGYQHELDLEYVHASLKRVRASIYEEAWLTREGGGWALVRRPRDSRSLEDAALTYAEQLYKRGRIGNVQPRRIQGYGRPTHVVRNTGGGGAMLVRLRFACCRGR